MTFHDGTPLNAEAARASFERLLRLDFAPDTVLGRFIADPAQIVAPSGGESTDRFTSLRPRTFASLYT